MELCRLQPNVHLAVIASIATLRYTRTTYLKMRLSGDWENSSSMLPNESGLALPGEKSSSKQKYL
jgi:hypothetical protein